MVQSYLSTFCGIAVASLFAGWGFGGMMSTLWKVRGREAGRVFWVSVVGYAVLITSIWVAGVVATSVLDMSDGGLQWLLFLFLPFAFGLFVCPLITLTLRRRNPALFRKAAPSPAGISSKAEADIPSRPVPAPSAPTREKSGRIFVSYRRSDSADISGRIYDRLIARFGKEAIFKDVDSIPLGLDFKEYLQKKVGECSVLLAVIGDHWLDARDGAGNRRLEDPNDFVRIEIQSALERGIPVIPLLVREAHMPPAASLPAGLQKLVYRNGQPVRPDPDFHRDMDRLISALEALEPR